MVLVMQKLGINVEAQHHEVATAGQAEIDMKSSTLAQMADQLVKYKYVVKNVARATADGDLHAQAHLRGQRLGHALPPVDLEGRQAAVRGRRLRRLLGARPALRGRHPEALARAGGLHEPDHELVQAAGSPGYEAPVNLALSSRNRSASCRIPMYSQSPKAKRIEVRYPDPSCNPYLAFSAMLMAGLDGIENKIDPGEPLDKNIYALSPEEAASRVRPCRAASTRRSTASTRTTPSSSRATCSPRTPSRPGSATSARTR